MTAAAIWSGVCEGRTPMLPWAKYEGTYGNSDGFDTRIHIEGSCERPRPVFRAELIQNLVKAGVINHRD